MYYDALCIQISMNVVTLSEIHVAMKHVKIPMDLTTAFVHLVMPLIQVGKFVLVSSCNLYLLCID